MKDTQQLISDEDIAWLKAYVANAAPTGNERNGQKMWIDRIMPNVDEVFIDPYGSAAAIIGPGMDFRVAMEAHADEIAWYVHTISEDGFIHVEETGGTDPGIAPSQKVTIHTDKGKVDGIFGWPAIHERNLQDDAPKKKTIFIDCGCTCKEEVEALGIEVGDYITYDSGLYLINKKYFSGRALDNRIGGFIMARTARLLKENNIQLPYSLYILNCVQEEIGTRGAEMMAYRIRPNCAFVVDVTHDNGIPMVDKDTQGDISLGKGPVVTKSPPVHSNLRNLLVDTARKHGIPFQRGVVAKSTGTDTDAFAYQREGIPSCLLSLPLRYMHTTVETVHREDVENTIRLLYYVLQEMHPGFDFDYFKV